MSEEYPLDEIKDSPVFGHNYCSKPTYRSGDLVLALKWRIVGMVKGHTYMYLGEEVCDLETIWGTVWEEFPVASLVPYEEELACESIQNCDSTRGEFDPRCLLVESSDWRIPQQAGVSDCDYGYTD